MSEQPWSQILTAEEVIEIHERCIERWGGDSSPDPSSGCLDRSLGAAWTAEMYTENDDAMSGLCFAGCVLFYLVKNHCFVDGNKRVAWASCMEALRSLGLTIEATDGEAEQFCLDVISGKALVKTATDICSWLTPRLVALPE
jgi:death-on-curing protein